MRIIRHTSIIFYLLGVALSQTVTVNNIDDNSTPWVQPNAGWKYYGSGCKKPGCDPGGIGMPTSTSQSINNATPSHDGLSMKVSITGPPNTNVLFPFIAGVLDSATTFECDYWVYPSANSAAAQTFEFDMFLFSTGLNKQFMFGTQCNQVRGVWQVWDMLNYKWYDSVVPCSLPPATWTHVNQKAHRINGDTGCSGQPCQYFDTITVNGVIKNYGATGPMKEPAGPLPSGWLSGVGWQPQIDIGAAAATISLNLDQVTFTASIPSAPGAPTSLVATPH